MNELNNQTTLKDTKKNFKLILIIIILLISIIGTTYAYFAITLSNNIIGGNAADVELTITVTKVLPTTEGVDNILVTNFNELSDVLNDDCVDGEFALCQVYKVNLANASGKVNTNVKGSLSFNNETTPNLSWIYLGSSFNTSITYTSAMLGGTFNTADDTYTSFVDNYLLSSGSNTDFYILVWINETEEAQEDEGIYSGTVRFEDSNGNGATATFAG